MSSLISHSMVILFGVFLILFSIILTESIKNDYRNFVSEEGIKHVCMLVRGAVSKIYVPNSAVGMYNDTMGSVILRMPDKIADANYRTSFFNKSVRIEVFSEQRPNTTCIVGFDGIYYGSAAGGTTKITIFHYVNGTKMIEMRNV